VVILKERTMGTTALLRIPFPHFFPPIFPDFFPPYKYPSGRNTFPAFKVIPLLESIDFVVFVAPFNIISLNISFIHSSLMISPFKVNISLISLYQNVIAVNIPDTKISASIITNISSHHRPLNPVDRKTPQTSTRHTAGMVQFMVGFEIIMIAVSSVFESFDEPFR
jgi:hypothetical protein